MSIPHLPNKTESTQKQRMYFVFTKDTFEFCPLPCKGGRFSITESKLFLNEFFKEIKETKKNKIEKNASEAF